MSGKAIVLDANILIRAALGAKVRALILNNASSIRFFTPDVALADARKYLPALLKKHGVEPEKALQTLERLECIVQVLDFEMYQIMQQKALQRISLRDADDWPVLACAMTLNCPVWTEDADFFGTGVAVWTSDRVGLYFD